MATKAKQQKLVDGQKLIVTQVRSGTGHLGRQKLTLHALGLGRIGRRMEHKANPALLGMLRSVSHLIEVERG